MIRMNIKYSNFCCENYSLIENYEEAVSSPEKYVLHHRMECIETGAVVNSSKQDLIDWGLYYNRPADELIFMKESEHKSLHGRNMLPETKDKLRCYAKLADHSKMLYGRKHMSDEAKRLHSQHLSEALKGHEPHITTESRHKISEALKGKQSVASETRKFVAAAYKEYKANGGTLKWNEFQKENK